MRNARHTRGFTLIELIMVVVILGVLAALVVPNFTGRTQEAKITAASTQLSSFDVALQMYEGENGVYPTTAQGLKALVEKPTTSPVPDQWKRPYLKNGIPADPFGTEYKYVSPGKNNSDSYDLSSAGPDGQHGTDDDITNWGAE